MNFWENVDFELKYLGITRKELAIAVGFNVSNIANGIRDGNVPSAETALKISDYLGVSMKCLLTGQEENRKNDGGHTSEALKKYKKYQAVIDSLEAMPESMRSAIVTMVLSLEKSVDRTGKHGI